jgi:phosphoribosylformimino-5-aminoimidazole carboxamide ribotide isomerase
MNLYPAVDMLGGKAVRLERGDYAREKSYDDDPLDAASRWVSEGAVFLHLVDLDGAREGKPVNMRHLRRIWSQLADAVTSVQYGGGLRTRRHVEEALEAGADRAVLGTAAFLEPGLLDELLPEHVERLAVAVDVRRGRIAVKGWLESTGRTPSDAIARLVERGVGTVVYTDVDRDGMLEGIDEEAVQEMSTAATGAQLIYSGGIASLTDLRLLAELGLPNLEGVIVGKALYERRFTVAEAQAALGPAPGSARSAGDR